MHAFKVVISKAHKRHCKVTSLPAHSRAHSRHTMERGEATEISDVTKRSAFNRYVQMETEDTCMILKRDRRVMYRKTRVMDFMVQRHYQLSIYSFFVISLVFGG